jgi:glycerate kinase
LKIVVAPNAYKGALSASKAAQAIALGLGNSLENADISCIPVADGGDGLLDVVTHALDGDLRHISVHGPLLTPISAQFCHTKNGLGAIEMALASGIALLSKQQLNPLETSTMGTGELLEAAIESGCARILVGLGGSATNDGGIGLAHALGYRFLDKDGSELPPIGGNLQKIAAITADNVLPQLANVEIIGVCDVTNPLCGPEGASAIFGPQKGADPKMVEELDAGLANLASIVKRDLGSDHANVPGAGAAGGLGFGLLAFCGAKLEPGIDLILKTVNFSSHLRNADLCITGEGRIDEQTQHGKAPAGVALACKELGVPCVALVGSAGTELGELPQMGLTASFALADGPMTLESSMAETERLLQRAGEQIGALFAAGRQKNRVPGS